MDNTNNLFKGAVIKPETRRCDLTRALELMAVQSRNKQAKEPTAKEKALKELVNRLHPTPTASERAQEVLAHLNK